MTYSAKAMERVMKIQEVLLRAMSGFSGLDDDSEAALLPHHQ